MKSNIIDFCTYHAKNMLILVNATDKVLRLQEIDGTIHYIPSSVYPKDMNPIPDIYIEKAKDYDIIDLQALCNSSLYIDVKVELEEIRKCVYKEKFVCSRKGILDIINKITKNWPTDRLVIIGSSKAAKAFPSYIVEPVYLEDNITIRCDYFKSYRR